MDNMRNQAHDALEEARHEVTINRRPWLGRVTVILIVVYTVLLLAFGLLAWWVHIYPVNGLDVAITLEIQEFNAPWFSVAMIIISYPGNSLLLAMLVGLAALIFWLLGMRLEALCILILSLVSYVLNNGLKLLIARPRPTANLVDIILSASGKSFPSGHVMSYVAFWGLLFSFGIILFDGWRWWRVLLLAVSAFFVLTVGVSRIYLGDHWASDVIGAYLISGVLLGVTLGIYLPLKRKGLLKAR